MKLPNHIKRKIELYISFAQKSNKYLHEINDWLKTKGIDAENVASDQWDEQRDSIGASIQDILIDGSIYGDPESTINAIEKTANK